MHSQLLISSSASTDESALNIVQSTCAVVFLGTPHRGSQDKAKAGDVVRKLLSGVLRMDTSPLLLNTLGLKNADLERIQEGFSTVWNKYDFQVKTFQEGLGLIGVNIGKLNETVSCLPSSSFL